MAVVVALVVAMVAVPGVARADTNCAVAANPVLCENALPGTPESEWGIAGVGDPSIQGFATDISVNVGSQIQFKVKTDARAYTIKIYRLGWYGGDGARQVAQINPSAALPQTQPACVTSAATEIYDCGTWAVSASWTVPTTMVSGVYIARLIRSDNGNDSHIPFVVRNDASHSPVFFQTSDSTWQAYNTYGGSDFYEGAANGRAYKISYNRPFATRGDNAGRDFLFSNEYPMLRFLERNGYDVSYTTDLDSDRRGALIKNHKIFISTGHDEYWSQGQWDNVAAARDAGVNLAFFSGNEVYWRTRWEASQDGSSTAYRTLVCYKETWANGKIDPSPEWTGTWRDPRFTPPATGGGSPENALTGTIYRANHDDLPIQVPSDQGKLRFWRNTPVANLSSGQTATLADHTVGYESDEDLDNGFRPAGLIRLSTTIGDTPQLLTDFGNTVEPGTTQHHMTMYRAPSGALVFSAGTIQYAWGLDDEHDGTRAPADPVLQQATVNLFADMGVQPGSLMAGLVAASKSSDTTAPTAAFTSPASGATVSNGALVTVQGTATDAGGRVAGVEVSTDGGATWHPATGTTSWSYTFPALATSTIQLKARAIDDSANIGAAASRQITVNGPLSIFGAVVPATPAVDEGLRIEVGVRFTPKTDGYVTGMRFYKGTGNTGTHVGTLWTSTGTVLATGTFVGETATGWQTLAFASPVPVNANTTYVVSYVAPSGHFALDPWVFSYRDVGSDALVANRSTTTAGNGVFKYGGGFPTDTNNDANYYVDVVFSPGASFPPIVTATTPVAGASEVALGSTLTATFSKAINQSTLSFTLSNGGAVPGSVSYNATTRTATFTPSAPFATAQTYTASVTASDTNGNAMTEPKVWSFTTVVDPSISRLFAVDAVPTVAAANDSGAVELGVKFTPSVDGLVRGVRYYQGAGNTGTHIGNLWTANGTLLARATFGGSTSVGWQSVLFDNPVAIDAGVTYVASYYAPNGHYAVDAQYFTTPHTSGSLTAPAGANGVYRYASSTSFPTDSYNSANYWVDVLFAGGISPPLVTSTTPPSGDEDIALDVHPTATFSKAIDPASLAFTLSSPSGTVAGSASYDGTTRTATFTPSAALAVGTSYTARVTAKSPTGDDMLAPKVWSFTTVVDPSIFRLFGTNAVPANASANESNPVELGVKFTPSVNGLVTGLRYYQGAGNTGTHIGNLWTTNGALLARATFQSDTQVGWHTVLFAKPVHVTAGTTYVASYFAPNGHYSYNPAYFTSPLTRGPLTAPGGANGVYRYASNTSFPNETHNSNNYWVDPIFTTEGDSSGPATYSVFVDADVPANVNWNDPGPLEIGMKFSSDVAGSVTAIRFYKGPLNTGTHVGSLWTASGVLLGQVTFTNETASGWQTATLSTPVAITAGTTYIVSYYAPSGQYAMDLNGFANPYDVGPLHVPANGGAYLYASGGGFPTGASPNRYSVDIVLVAAS